MKNTMRNLLLCLLLCTLLLTGCFPGTDGENVPATVEVTYVLGNGEENITQTVTTLFGIVKPPEPKKENYLFTGWYKDENATLPYDMSSTLKKDITLYAGWTFDYETYINEAGKNLMPSTLKIQAYTYTSNFFGSQITSSQAGSGVIIFEDKAYYYLLTNHHVTYLTANGTKAYVVTDLYENEYDATLLSTSAEYDLSLLRIQKNAATKPLLVADLAETTPTVGALCVAVGTPGGVRNAITFGHIIDFETVTLTDEDKKSSNVTLPVLWHTAPMDHGSSGGALFSDDGKLIGINYACSLVNDEFSRGYSITIDDVRAFLNETLLQDYI